MKPPWPSEPGRSGPSSTTTYKQMTRSGSGSGYVDGRDPDRRTARRSVPRRQSRALADVDSRAPRQQPSGPDEHHDDEEGERQHVPPLQVGEQPAERDDLGEYKRRHEAADEITEPAEHANQKCDRPERQADKRMDVVLQHQQAGGEAG